MSSRPSFRRRLLFAAATTAFDPAHPLWEFTLVGRLQQGRAALLMKLHHSLTDGIGGMELALRLFDCDVAASRRLPREPMPPAPAADGASGSDLDRALQLLTADQREVVLLVGLEGLSYAETAEVLSIPMGTVMSRLARGRDRLRGLLAYGLDAEAEHDGLRRVR